ncbi:MAG: glutamine--fructose-6-phosphate transaminase (isomerizing), partial [bacterium]
RKGSPLVVGWGEGEMYLGSDALAVGPFTQKISYLEEGDFVAVTRSGARMFDASGAAVERPIVQVSASSAMVEKGSYRHFMEKEIHEQPDSVQHTLSHYLDLVTGKAKVQTLEAGAIDFAAIDRIQIVACGTAFYAGQIGRYAFEKIAGLPCDVEIASEFRYRSPAVTKGTLAVAVSQSGETADTLASLTWCKAQGLKTAAIVNVHSSSMAREADVLWPTHAGPEIGVASTKAFTAQVSALLALAVAAGVARGRIDGQTEGELVKALFEAPRLISEALQMDADIRAVTAELSKASDVLFLGRGAMFPLAMEGALKLKEISYIHAEGMPAAEMKHGPIALINEGMPAVFIANKGRQYEKVMSNIQEVRSRGGHVIAVATEGDTEINKHAQDVMYIPDVCEPLSPMLAVVPLQLMAYYAAVARGHDVDKPRNLAKSVTVE